MEIQYTELDEERGTNDSERQSHTILSFDYVFAATTLMRLCCLI